jgi:hypothetical protein
VKTADREELHTDALKTAERAKEQNSKIAKLHTDTFKTIN